MKHIVLFFFFRTLFMLLSKMINQMQHLKTNAALDIPHIPPFQSSYSNPIWSSNET